MTLLIESLKSNWPDELRQQFEDSYRPVPELFRPMFNHFVGLIGMNKWNAFCLDGKVKGLTLIHGDTHQSVIEKLYMRIFPRRKLLSDHKKMFQKCVEAMVEDDMLYFEFFYYPTPERNQRRDS